MAIQTVNPTTGKVIKTYKEMSSRDIESHINASHAAFLKWRTLSITKRAVCFTKLGRLLLKRKNAFAKLMAQEMGKPLAQGVGEIEKCARTCDYYAKHAAKHLKPQTIKTDMKKSYVTYQPLGVVFAIMPWNFPFWQVIRFAAPTLMAGNAALLKHAPISTGTALTIEKLFKEAGFPKDLFRTLVMSEKKAQSVIAHPKVTAVTLTGSTRAGKAVGSAAAGQIKKSVLELGGCDAYVILKDADLEQAAEACVSSRMNNAGQSCIAAKRLIVVDAVHDVFVKKIQTKLKKYKMGDPLKKEITCGPLARKDLRDKVAQQVRACAKKGAAILMGGTAPKQPGFYFSPTLMVNVKPGMPAYDEEIFGPVVAIIRAKHEDDAMRIANSTSYGLGSAIFTKNLKRGEQLAVEKMQAGMCTVNAMVVSDPRLPFGGIKQSGYGRELADAGMHSFVNIKTINLR